MISKTFTCVVCPMGCELTATFDENDKKSCTVTGNTCPRGEKYAKSEIIAPERTLTSTVKLESKTLSMLPVRTSAPIPKDKMFEAMQQLNKITVKAPVMSGDIIVNDFIVDGISLICCRSVSE